MHKKVRSALCIALAFIFFVGQCALVSAAETNVWQDRHRLSMLASPLLPPKPLDISAAMRPSGDLPSQGLASFPNLPLQYGSIRRIVGPAGISNKSTVLLIQDIHRNPEAQRNIGRALTSLSWP